MSCLRQHHVSERVKFESGVISLLHFIEKHAQWGPGNHRTFLINPSHRNLASLALVDQHESRGELKNYHLLPSVRGDCLDKPGRLAEASAEFERAASLTRNARERELLLAASARTEPGKPR